MKQRLRGNKTPGYVIREVRGALKKNEDGATIQKLSREIGRPPEVIENVLKFLEDDEVICRDGTWYHRELWRKRPT